MTITITRGLTSIEPYNVMGYQSTRLHGNIIHPIINSVDPDVSFAPAGLRRGTLRFFSLTDADNAALEALHALTGVFTLAFDEQPVMDMSYVPYDRLVSAYDVETSTWFLDVPYQEVSP